MAQDHPGLALALHSQVYNMAKTVTGVLVPAAISILQLELHNNSRAYVPLLYTLSLQFT